MPKDTSRRQFATLNKLLLTPMSATLKRLQGMVVPIVCILKGLLELSTCNRRLSSTYTTLSPTQSSIELDASTVVGNATIMPSAEVEATLVGFSSKFVKIAPIGKTWRVNVSQLTYLTGHHSTYVNDEAGPQCTYFSSIIIDTNIMIEKPFCHWISKGYRVCSCQ